MDAPSTEWDVEIALRVQDGEDEERARAGVIQNYLDACDPRPLVEAIRQGRPIPALIRRRIAAMFEDDPSTSSNERIPVRLRIEITREDRPLRENEHLTRAEQRCYVIPFLMAKWR